MFNLFEAINDPNPKLMMFMEGGSLLRNPISYNFMPKHHIIISFRKFTRFLFKFKSLFLIVKIDVFTYLGKTKILKHTCLFQLSN